MFHTVGNTLFVYRIGPGRSGAKRNATACILTRGSALIPRKMIVQEHRRGGKIVDPARGYHMSRSSGLPVGEVVSRRRCGGTREPFFSTLLNDSECGIGSASGVPTDSLRAARRWGPARLAPLLCLPLPCGSAALGLHLLLNPPPTRNRVQRIDIDNLKFAMLDLRPIWSLTPDVITLRVECGWGEGKPETTISRG